MKKILIFLLICVTFIGCPAYTPPVVECEILETEVKPGDFATLYSKKYSIFNDDWSGNGVESAIEQVGIICNGAYKENNQLFINYLHIQDMTITKISGDTATFAVPFNSVTGVVYFRSGYTTNKLAIQYPQELDMSDDSVSVGDEVTITSGKDFFDKDTFSKKKLQQLSDIGYNLVWITTGDNNKLPLDRKKLIIEKITSNSVTFIIPEEMKTGTVNIINEGGFEKSNYTDEALIVCKANENAFYSTKKALEITR
ncbi:MAG: hypothetical protein A2015_07990 [Spirochaetes bacterium GWF1_31_7]|nr:MAG: hypothetical protein A2Y30_02080 [Spirochaetes bacterium GWE1_32_154]OHD46980.1 MAG: hypothetical protein A2015_07990 [Spirochaetes bacterium GWF1_31_7]OHD49760.1 MAG: hypothetical protein A2Y29_06190 [Spirochaetes bacterium GWE2_31_10]HBD95510.1 hypothetical protein [Spirochaetia bacterium]HBI36978.1 hypothetical protein [Spirochaetia bacterium]